MTAKDLIKKLQALDPDTVIVSWDERESGHFAVKLGDVQEAILYPLDGNDDQYMPAKGGGVKMVSVY